MQHMTHDMWFQTPGMWHLARNTQYFYIYICSPFLPILVSVLLSALIKRFSIACMILLTQLYKVTNKRCLPWNLYIEDVKLNLKVMYFVQSFHQLGPLGRVGQRVYMSMCVFVWCPLPMQFFCVVWLVQSVPRPWTGAISISISISSRALKTRLCSGVQSWSRSRSRVEP